MSLAGICAIGIVALAACSDEEPVGTAHEEVEQSKEGSWPRSDAGPDVGSDAGSPVGREVGAAPERASGPAGAISAEPLYVGDLKALKRRGRLRILIPANIGGVFYLPRQG